MHEMPETAVAFIAVGANIEPERNILAALIALQAKVRVVASSTFYRTEPLGRPDQPRFINGVWRVETPVPAHAVKQQLLRPIEAQLGRGRTQDRYGPRTIDLDLVLYNDIVVNRDDLILPHPDVERAFVYFPLVELLTQIPSEFAGNLAGRMRRLLPLNVPMTGIGEPLGALTRRLRELVEKQTACPE